MKHLLTLALIGTLTIVACGGKAVYADQPPPPPPTQSGLPDDIKAFNEMIKDPAIRRLFRAHGAEPWFTAPHPAFLGGPELALGGLDVQELLLRVEKNPDDLDGVYYASVSDLPDMLDYLYRHRVVPPIAGDPGYSVLFAFRTAENRRYIQAMLEDGRLIVAVGGWCRFGVSACYPDSGKECHFAQPGHLGYTIDVYAHEGRHVTVLTVNFYKRAGDYPVLVEQGDAYSTAAGFFREIHRGVITELRFERPHRPIFEPSELE